MMMPHAIADFLFEHGGLEVPEAFRREYWEFNARHGEPWAVGVDPTAMPLGIYGDSAKVQTKFGVTKSHRHIFQHCALEAAIRSC